MDAVQHFFEFSICTGCGFPKITLTGEPDDWRKLLDKAKQLQKYDLDWWLEALLPALEEFVKASEGKPNLNFWRSLCNINVGLSFKKYQPVTGWIQVSYFHEGYF